MKNIFKSLAIGLLGLFAIAGIAYATTLNFVETPTDFLYTSLSSGGTSMVITPYPTDLDGNKLTITDFGSNPTLTVDPGVKNYEEIIGFTGIVDNGNNTATLTGLTRDLASKSPYVTSGTGKQHGAGALVVFSNNPQMYARFAALENNQTITGVWTYSTSPVVPTPTAPTQAVNKSYADALALAGCPNASTILQGCVQIPSAIQMASSTASGSTGALLVIPTSLSTSTPGFAGLWNVVSLNDGKLSPNWLNGTGEAYTFASTTTANATAYTQTVGTLTATSSITLNGVSVAQRFGGSGIDGALVISSGTTTIALGSNSYFEKNYTSISITGTGHLAFSGAATNGTFIVLRSQGNVTMTCNPAPCIDVSGLGAPGGAGGIYSGSTAAGAPGSNSNSFFIYSSNGGSGGTATAGTAGNGGTTPTAISPSSWPVSSSTLLKYGGQFWVGAGGGGGNASNTSGIGGTGGQGGGGLLIESGGSLNFTTAGGIYAVGLIGGNASGGTSAGGGGGSGGFVKIIYNLLTSKSGTINISGGTGGLCFGNGTDGGGGGGATGFTAGGNGTGGACNVAVNGGTGATGYQSIELNTYFY